VRLKTVIAGALGECVHVAGVYHFLQLAEQAGWRTVFLGPAVGIQEFIRRAVEEKADLVGVSYRLTPENGERLLAEFLEAADPLRETGVKFVFGGTPPIAERTRTMGFFDRVFDGSEPAEDLIAYLKGNKSGNPIDNQFPQNAVDRIRWKSPIPLLRHHFGLPDFEATRAGIRKISEARVLDVISLGTDQDAQENFFHPERQDPRRKGAGGVPVRSAEEYRTLYESSRTGNYPLMRTYSGTDDFIRQAEMFVETINIAWCAIPLFWFNRMDGRGPVSLKESIICHQEIMQWYGARNIPVELNEPHHWGMREAPDVICVVSGYLSAFNALAFGVRHYIAQFMFNSPPQVSDAMDLAKMLAILEMIRLLEGPDFKIWTQTRTGLLSYPLEPAAAKAHLASSIYLQMALKPDIVHVVSYTEADHAATADDVIESCLLARRAIQNAMSGQPDMTLDPKIIRRKDYLIEQAKNTLAAITKSSKSKGDPFIDAATLEEAVLLGILDAPQLVGNRYGKGRIRAGLIDGGWDSVDEEGKRLDEWKRLKQWI
jgi:methylmalonyl-CoA mutase cobalamin-binding subunit